MHKIINPLNLTIFFVSFLFFFPLFPGYMGASQVHVNLVFFVFSVFIISFILMLVFTKKLFGNAFFFIFVIYFFLFALLLLSANSNDQVISYSDIPSLFRPVMLFWMFLFFYILIPELKTQDQLERCMGSVFSMFKLLVIAGLVYAVIEVFFIDIFKDFIFNFYKRVDKKDIYTQATTFFGQTYYSSYAYLIAMVFLMANYMEQRRLKDFVYILAAFAIIILSQSKSVIGVSLVFMVIFMATLNIKFLIALIYLFFFSIISFILFDFLYLIHGLLEKIDTIGTRSLLRIIDNPGESGTLQVRLDQVISTVAAILDRNFLLGLGLGRDIYLESWVSEVLYRYGFFGIFLFVVILLFMFYVGWSVYKYQRERGLAVAFFGLFFGVWFLLLPATMFSSNMIENSKTGILSMFVMALFIRVYVSSMKIKRGYIRTQPDFVSSSSE